MTLKMAASLRRLHHIAFHVRNGDKLTNDLVNKYKFNLFAERLTSKARQVALKNGSAVFVVNERLNLAFLDKKGQVNNLLNEQVHDHRGFETFDYKNIRFEHEPEFLYDVYQSYAVNTACNVSFEVNDVEGSSKRLRNQGCDILVPPTKVQDRCGYVTYSVVKSIVGNVCHTLIDRTNYDGDFLPGFCKINNAGNNVRSVAVGNYCDITHFDHITYACPQQCTPEILEWYERMFGFERFLMSRDEDVDEGYVITGDSIGLRLTAMQFWKCSEVGLKLPSHNKKQQDCKFVVAESLPQQGRNQVDTFLEQHHGPGIQHVGLYTPDIISTARTMEEAGVEFVSPPPAYYTEVGKQKEILEAGHDPQLLSQQGILLDAEVENETPQVRSQDQTTNKKKHLLQVFTKPLFSEDTFFLELIERRGASGFGEGNIRALWRSVQAYMECQKQKQAAHQTKVVKMQV
ncbi:4-hydroxyphenylpyruvate dioxygenase-like protein [Huso huso]|uniref:4-hydroxyphenylpyruvate dioxygenase n=1 Tax=Huso huso TaxID=61971 RepID=A0ABR0ZRB8_HUSHU